jgi:hypothetical protein
MKSYFMHGKWMKNMWKQMHRHENETRKKTPEVDVDQKIGTAKKQKSQ